MRLVQPGVQDPQDWSILLPAAIQAQLFGVTPTDLPTLAAATLGIVSVAALSGYFPARRATAIDPVRALHWE